MVVLINIGVSWEKLTWHSKETKKFLFNLPLELAILIFNIALRKNEISWRNEHANLMWSTPIRVVTITTDYTIEIEKLKKKYEREKDYKLGISDIQKKNFNFSCLEIIENLGIQERQFVKQFYDTEKCIEVPQKFTNKLCKPINVNTKITDDYSLLRHERIEEFTLTNIPDNINYYLTNQNRLIYDKGKPTDQFWAENKCRCFTCDLIRHSYRNYTMKDVIKSSIWPKNRRICISYSKYCKFRITDNITCYDWYKTYDNLVVDIENKRWKSIESSCEC